MQQGIVREISSIILYTCGKKIKENVIVVVSDGHHDRSPSIIIRFYSKSFFEQYFHNLLLSSRCCKVEDTHSLFGLNVILNKLVLQ